MVCKQTLNSYKVFEIAKLHILTICRVYKKFVYIEKLAAVSDLKFLFNFSLTSLDKLIRDLNNSILK